MTMPALNKKKHATSILIHSFFINTTYHLFGKAVQKKNKNNDAKECPFWLVLTSSGCGYCWC
jgi:hypothetical protein